MAKEGAGVLDQQGIGEVLRGSLKNPLGIYVNGLSWSRELDSSEGTKP